MDFAAIEALRMIRNEEEAKKFEGLTGGLRT